MLDFNKLREVIGENAHVSGRFNLPNTVMLKFRNNESKTISNANLEKIAEGSFDEDGTVITKGLGFKMMMVMIPESQVQESMPFVNSCNDAFFAALGKDLEENKKIPSGNSSTGNPADKKARQIIAMVANANEIGMPITNTIDMTEELPEIGVCKIVEGVIENEYVEGVKTKDEANKTARLEALKISREKKKEEAAAAAAAAAAEGSEA